MSLFGIGKTKEAKIFNVHYKSLLKKIKMIPGAENASFELLPAMYVICDYAAVCAKKDRITITDNIIKEMRSLHRRLNPSILESRVELYGQVLRGKPIRGEWLLGRTDGWNSNAIMSITAVLADILYNPNCANDYDHAPLLMKGITVPMGFVAGIKPVVSEFNELFKEIYDL